jgi:hypothetical protein
MTEKKTDWRTLLWEGVLRLVRRTLNALTYAPQDGYDRLIHAAAIGALFIWGVSLVGTFFSWGNISFDFLDWAEVTGPRYALLRDAAQKGVLPLHAANTTALRGVTDRYFAIADTPFLPEYLLLPYLETGQYIFYDTLLFYTIGFIGIFLIYRKYHLSPLTFTFFYLLFNFNGNLTSHLAVGHSIWIGQFLLPYFILLVMSLVERQSLTWRWYLGLVMTMLVILGAGYFHLYFWCLLFLVVLALLEWRLIKPVFLGGLFIGLASLPRLLPVSLSLSGITQEYLGGFSSLTDMLDGLIVLRDPLRAVHAITDTFPLNGWETDFYVGLSGLALLIVCGILLPLRREQGWKAPQARLLAACLVLAAFSIGGVFAQVTRVFTIPPFTGERVTSRMLILPLMFVLTLSVIYLPREFANRQLAPWMQLLGIGFAGLLFHDLHQHLQAWRIRYLDAMVDLFPKVNFDPTQHSLANHPDPTYTAMLAGGAIIALITLGFLVAMSFRKSQAS